MRREGEVRRRRLHRHVRHLSLAAFSLALLAGPLSPNYAQDDEIESHKRGLAEVEQRMRDLEQDLGTGRGRRRELIAELERRERNIADLARAGHQLMAMIRTQEKAVAELETRLVAEREALRRERAALGNLLRSAYAVGRGDRIRMLLDQDDPNRLDRIMSYYGLFNRYRIKRIDAVERRMRDLEDLTREAKEEKARLSLLARKQDETRAGLAKARDERTVLLTTIERTIATQAETIADLRLQAREMNLLLEHLERKARELPEADLRQESLSQLRGRLAWPLAGASVQSRFGSRKGEGAQVWDGVVLRAEEGAEVRAIHNGRVAYADWLRGFGLLLIIEHDHDYMTLYGHNQTLLKEPGEWVAAGDTVALSGSSGGRPSPGLYFAIRHRGRPVNPEHWCRTKMGLLPQSAVPAPWRRNTTWFHRSNLGVYPKPAGAVLAPSYAKLRNHSSATSL